MLTKLVYPLLLVISASNPSATLNTIRSQPESFRQATNQSESIDFCALVDSPARYRGRRIRLRAVLVEHPRNGVVVDGGDSYLYGAGCENKKRKVVVGWSAGSYQNSTARESLQEIRTNVNGFGVSRASVVLSGTLSGPGKEKFEMVRRRLSEGKKVDPGPRQEITAGH